MVGVVLPPDQRGAMNEYGPTSMFCRMGLVFEVEVAEEVNSRPNPVPLSTVFVALLVFTAYAETVLQSQ